MQNSKILEFIRNLYIDLYSEDEFVPLHAPTFSDKEKEYLLNCLESTFVSSVGEYVTRFERSVCEYTHSRFAIACVNGTSALHLALCLAGVKPNTEVITQPLTFVATANAIVYAGAQPVFLDINSESLGLSDIKLEEFLQNECELRDIGCFNKKTNKQITACLPMHTFGHPCKIDKIKNLCDEYKIALVEDAAESLGSTYGEKHTGTFGKFGVLSFNGNKIITTGGGGMVLTDSEEDFQRAKHVSTTAKRTHQWEYFHDQLGYNYRLPNINAALGVAQMEKLNELLRSKREIAAQYENFFVKNFDSSFVKFCPEPKGTRSNYWLNSIIFSNQINRDEFLKLSNEAKIMTRPAWNLLHKLPMYENCQTGDLSVSEQIANCLVNIPSSPILSR